MNKHICIHGHFYQPPRENPWLEAIELQDSAYPYKDWNERITAECYAPNVASRILNANGDIVDIINNYSKINFNFGPTLLSWLQRNNPDIYLAILKADKSSQHFFHGHGSAIAQTYNHMIMPLANERDKVTQTIWGIRDFEFRFKRKPVGIWLPETAVDMATLEVLAAHNIQYTVLAPYQAAAFRQIGNEAWTELGDRPIDSRRSYLCRLDSGKKIAIFFYDGPVSHDIAFAGLLNNGEVFADRLMACVSDDKKAKELVLAATDGETYGHHHHFGNMALSYCLHHIETHQKADVTVLSEYLAKNPPQYEVKIKDRSAWSCAHGVGRWEADCGCRVGGNNWNQQWRAPLRMALNWLRDELAAVYEREFSGLNDSPWELRNAYIDVILDRADHHVMKFFDDHFSKKLTIVERIRVLKLLEMQRYAMFMFTSCGWFFDEVSGIETVQILRYAARAIQLAKDVSCKDFEKDFLAKLQVAKSNLPECKNAVVIYQRFIKPDVIDILHVGAHFAISSLFQPYPKSSSVYSYYVEIQTQQLYEAGDHKLLVGRIHIRSKITWEEALIDFAVLYFGDYNISGGVRIYESQKKYRKMHDDLFAAFDRNDIALASKRMTGHFGRNCYTLWDLFKNEQGKVMEQIFEKTLNVIESDFRTIYNHYYPLMQVRPDFKMPLPKALAMSVEFVLNRDLAAEIERDQIDFDKMEYLIREMKRWNFTRDKEGINLVATKKLNKLMNQLTESPRHVYLLEMICDFLRVCRILPLELDVWQAQNIYFSMSQRLYPQVKQEANEGDQDARIWVMTFEQLSGFLKVDSS